MGNHFSTDSADHQYFARPKPGRGETPRRGGDWVEVVDDDARGRQPVRTDRADRPRPADPAGRARQDGLPEEGGPVGMDPEPSGRRRIRINPYLAGSWVMVGLVLVPGLLWIAGVLQPPQDTMMVEPGTGRSVQDQTAILLTNLYYMGNQMLIFGLLAAAMLLAVHGVLHSRKADRPRPKAVGAGRPQELQPDPDSSY